HPVSKLSRILIALGAFALMGVFFAPLWSISLRAPQYPEGLGLQIRLTTITGNLGSINGLNHYIGMRAIEPSGIPEMRVFPLIVAALVILGWFAALLQRRTLIVAWLAGLALFGVAALADFWRWTYDYGHNLDVEHAIIKVPGM